MTSVPGSTVTSNGRDMDDNSVSDHVIIIAIGITVTLIVVIAVVVFLLVVFIRTRRAAEISPDSHQQDIPVHTTDPLLLGHSGPTWTSDFTQGSYHPPPQHGAISYQEGYQNMINAHFEGGSPGNHTISEAAEPIYMNGTNLSQKYIADNTPQYDTLRQASRQGRPIYDQPPSNAVVAPPGCPRGAPALGDYDYPGRFSPPVQLGRDYSRCDPAGETSPYDYPRSSAAVPSEANYDYPRPGQNNAPEAVYDYPRNNRAGETVYDYPVNGATAAVGFEHAPSGNRPSNNDQAIYENLSKANEGVYDRLPTMSRKVSVRGKVAQKNALPRFTSPFTR